MNKIFSILLLAVAVNVNIGAQTNKIMNTNKIETATFGGGCFWCMEAVYVRLPGVISVSSGYAGGKTENPTYRDVCNGNTGHAEVTQIVFDPAKISFDKLLTAGISSAGIQVPIYRAIKPKTATAAMIIGL